MLGSVQLLEGANLPDSQELTGSHSACLDVCSQSSSSSLATGGGDSELEVCAAWCLLLLGVWRAGRMNEPEQEQGDLLDCNTWEQLWRTEIEKERTGNWEPSSRLP